MLGQVIASGLAMGGIYTLVALGYAFVWTTMGVVNFAAGEFLTFAAFVFVASFGKYGGPSAERGIFKSTDGGKTWKKTLFRDDKTGGVDISIDRRNPSVMYAALWEAYRVEYQMSSGGPGSGLFKSTDGGDTWTEITRNKGLPAARRESSRAA